MSYQVPLSSMSNLCSIISLHQADELPKETNMQEPEEISENSELSVTSEVAVNSEQYEQSLLYHTTPVCGRRVAKQDKGRGTWRNYQRILSDLKAHRITTAYASGLAECSKFTQRTLGAQIDLSVQITLIYACDGWSAVTLARDLVDCDCIGSPALQIRVS